MNEQERYADKVDQELLNFNDLEIVHELPPIFHYWSNKYLAPRIQALGFQSITDFFVSYMEQRSIEVSPDICQILSLGSGNCDFEVDLANQLRERGTLNFRFICLEINEAMLARGRQFALERGLLDHFSFEECDLNRWSPRAKFDVALANHSLHHILALESVFDGVVAGLKEGGVFLINDMIGRNGHMRWPEALEIIRDLWKDLPTAYKYNHQLKQTQYDFVNWDCSTEGFEGVRAQDILPELTKRFGFDFFLGFCNVIDIFIDRGFGPNFDVEKEWDCRFIDDVHRLDNDLLETGQLKPTHMLAALKTEKVRPRIYNHLTAEFCTRWP